MQPGRRCISIKRLVQCIIYPMTRHSYRRFVIKVMTYISVVGMLFYVPYFVYGLYVRSVEMYFFQLHVSGQDTSHVPSSCVIPHYDPFDSSVLQYLYKWNPIYCGRTQPYFTYVDTEGFIHFNTSGIQESEYSEEEYECTYSEIVRCNGTDDKIDFRVPKIFRNKEKLPSPFVLVKCILPTGKVLYETVHAYVNSPPPQLMEKSKRVSSERPNLLIFGLDSMSRLNFVRQLPKTYEFLTKTLDAKVMRGMTKVGDNTYPNILTMLTGMAARKIEGIPGPVWGLEREHGFFDDVPHAWKDFGKQGYITMYAEDCPEMAAFNSVLKGFLKEPVHYYMRPFWLAMKGIRNFRSSDDRCYGNFPHYKYLFNYTSDFVKKMKDVHYFAFSYSTAYSHDHLNSVQVIDEDLRKLFELLYKRGDLDNTIFIVMGDHGNRLDRIRQSVIGRVEERMPFLSVSIGSAVHKRHPYMKKGLEANSDVLLSWYDVYEILMDVAMDNLEETSRVKRWGAVGYSPFRQVPRNRTCSQAGIPKQYCVCAREEPLPPHEPMVAVIAQDLVKHVNILLQQKFSEVCARLFLAEVVNAQLLLPNRQVARPEGFVATYRVTVRVSPSGGLLEGTLEKDAWSVSARVVGDVNRINRYGNQSHCIADKILQLYCYCTDLLATPAK